jgi:hypothetical protein
VLRNGVGPTLSAFNISAALYESTAVARVATMRAWAIGLTSLGIVALALVIAVVVKPTVWLVARNKREVLCLFATVPLPIVRAFEKKFEDRLEQLRRAREEEFTNDEYSDDDDDELAGGEDDEKEDGGDASANVQFDGANAVAAVAATAATLKTQSAVAAHARGKDSIVKELESSSSSWTLSSLLSFQLEPKHWTLFKVLLLLFASIVFFVSTYVTSFAALEPSLLSGPSVTNWAQHRQLGLIQTVFGLHKLLTQNYTLSAAGGGGSSGSVSVSVPQVAASLRLMVDAGDALAFGDGIRSSRFGMAAPTDAAVRAVLFVNGCASSSANADARFVSQARDPTESIIAPRKTAKYVRIIVYFHHA